ncbi:MULTISPECIES: hypothetical protein [unclassified Devosia]|uniref:hypothetical protein n=1 Tax=unclassified Devosia TaxID=196773 RepID=UPI001555AAB7
MKSIRLLPVLVVAISSLLVLKTAGLVFNGSYVLGPMPALAAGGGSSGGHGAPAETSGAGEAGAMLSEPTMSDASPTMADPAPVLGSSGAAGGHGAPSAPAAEHGAPAEHAAEAEHGATVAAETSCAEAVTTATHGESEPAETAGDGHGTANPLAESLLSTECDTGGDAVPMQFDAQGNKVPLTGPDGASAAQAALLERLSGRRGELDAYAEELAMRQALVDAAEKRLEERQGTLQAMEAQITALVDQREKLETGQFAGIVAMYEAMKPKDAAKIFNTLEMEVLLRVAKIMSPRKMAPILAAMEPARAQELTVRMADLADQPAGQMTANDLSQLPQIVGQ